MTSLPFNIDDVVEMTDVRDYENRREPRSDVFYEFSIAEAKVDVAKLNADKGTGGYLYLNLKVQALDKDANSMFTKFMNVSIPVIYQGHAPHESAAGLWNTTINAIFGDEWDEVRTDAATKKKVYLKNGKVLDKNAVTAGYNARSARAKALETSAIKSTIEFLNSLLGQTFFAKVEVNGKYTNVTKVTGIVPEGETVCYSSEEAYSKERVA